jgi:hypothetical protein
VLDQRVDDGAAPAYSTIGFDAEGPRWMFVQSTDLPAGRNRLMLDLGGEDDWQQQAGVESLGATRVADHEVDGVRWVEFRDPERNTFRIFAPRPVEYEEHDCVIAGAQPVAGRRRFASRSRSHELTRVLGDQLQHLLERLRVARPAAPL